MVNWDQVQVIPEPGYYKTRVVRNGLWVPVKVWYQDGDRDPETDELLSDQILRVQWAPLTKSSEWFEVTNPERWLYLRPIEEDEFRWLKILKNP